MEVLILCAVLIAAIGVLAYNRASLTMFTAAIAVILAFGMEKSLKSEKVIFGL